MKLTELRKKVKYLKSLLSEYDTLTALINSMKKCEKQGLNANDDYLANCIKRQDRIQTELESILK